ncbi:MAG: MFS transporter [Candidatus Marinimicrobia bacterium]|nr:MFS transporter [Candidatus Neomarinimicrobiota bacterium]
MTPKIIIRSYLVTTGIFNLSASIIWGINTLFLMHAGLDIFGVFVANGIFTASMALFEIPTGVLADTRGRRASFLLSILVILIGTLGYVWVAATSGSLLGFSIMSAVLGLGYTFYSGAVEAWLVDALKATGFQGNLDRVFAQGGMVFGAAMLVGSLGGGLLGTLDLALPYLVRSGLLIGAFGVAWFTMHDIGYTPKALRLRTLPREMGKIATASMTFGWRVISVRLLMTVSLIQAIFMAWGYHSWQPYFLGLLEREGAIWIAGVIAALISVATMIGNGLVSRLGHLVTYRSTILLWAVVGAGIGAVAVGLAGNFWLAVSLYLLLMVGFGAAGPVRQAYLHQLIPSEQRATIVSFDSLMGSIGSGGGQVGLGYLARQQSLSVGYITGGLLTLLALPVVLLLRRLRQPEDRMNLSSDSEPA